MDRCFKHPKTVCMDYQTHAKFSLQMAYIFAVGSLKAIWVYNGYTFPLRKGCPCVRLFYIPGQVMKVMVHHHSL